MVWFQIICKYEHNLNIITCLLHIQMTQSVREIIPIRIEGRYTITFYIIYSYLVTVLTRWGITYVSVTIYTNIYYIYNNNIF